MSSIRYVLYHLYLLGSNVLIVALYFYFVSKKHEKCQADFVWRADRCPIIKAAMIYALSSFRLAIVGCKEVWWLRELV
ncbi:hypothetical protein AG1IA_09621 [Rhizoctonia solani AG-1 IA]|uniref:Uncharacterized protein n=1 Tax=Thanatephorus cucumeris (strain AG1-IA) TaxID=983506 RepID=L8WEI3_THACA|nr:hypothetical protein AG1IA_09621 [Rhizoctonia solani AG-1 IA]